MRVNFQGKEMIMKKGDILEGVITDYTFPNKGSLMIDDRKVIIKGAFPGQKVRFMITKKKSGRAEGRVLEVVEPSHLEDAEPFCVHFGACGGCTYQTMSYENQLSLKAEMVKKMIDEAVFDYEWEGILASPLNKGYRNKMEFTFGDEVKDGPMTLGLHKKGSFYDILNITDCKIIDGAWNEILKFTNEFFAANNVPFYKKMKHEGILRNLVIRQSQATKEFLINLVTVSGVSDVLKLDKYVAGLLELEKSGHLGTAVISGILHTENDSLADVVQCDRMTLLYGKDYIIEEVAGLKFKISPFSFFQTNTKGCEVLYNKAREYVGDTKDKVIFDLYSGTGTITQMLSPVAKKVIGIEIVEEAVEAAKENARLNGLTNCEFIAGDVFKELDNVKEKPDIIVLDPPRDGIHPKALDKILAYGVEQLVYISCKPTSLVRDLKVMQERGYKVEKVCAVDEFPGTYHVETVVLLSQQKPDDVIEVEIELDELDLTSAESKATYAEIKDYVLKEHGLKVSSLYISQVKRKCGIEVGENYNLPKSEDSRQPQCPEEKEKAIGDALEHFGMV